MPLQAGERIGAYEIIDQVGQGGMATVYKAYHERLDRHVAVKLMHETFLQDEDFRARFQREARIVAKLEHMHIVQIYDFNEHQGIPYLVMKFIPGMTLKRYAIKQGLTLEETRDILREVADALDYAHRRGILHRDMKPSNILVDKDQRPYITDFGLARIAEAGASTISHDMLLGTPFYISPEQAQGDKQLDSRTDIYSLGVILYELVSGRVPFQADTPYAIVHGHIYQQPQPASSFNADLPSAVDAVLDVALAKDPANRYPTAKALVDAFAEAIQDSSAPTPPPQEIPRFDYDDLGDAFIERSRRQRRPHTPEPSVPSANPKRRVEAEFDLANVDFNRLGDSIQRGVTSFAEMIEERIDTELRHRRGIALTEEEIIRRQVKKRLEARREFVQHLATYIGVNTMLVVIWAATGGSFFWPIFPLFFWGMGVVGQGIEYYSEYGPGADQRAADIEDEVQRELQRRNGDDRHAADKPKHRLDDAPQRGGVRINDDGELTDSFIEEQRGGRR